jgi:predicted dehydrogenase
VRFVNVAYYRPAAKDEINGTHWHVQPEISGGGIFMDMAVHTLDILDFFFGAIEKVAALVSTKQVIMSQKIMLRYPLLLAIVLSVQEIGVSQHILPRIISKS